MFQKLKCLMGFHSPSSIASEKKKVFVNGQWCEPSNEFNKVIGDIEKNIGGIDEKKKTS